MENRRGKSRSSDRFYFSWAPKSLWTVTATMKLKDGALWKERYDKPKQHIKKQRHYFVNKGLHSQSYGFSSSHVWIWELDHKEGWVLKNWCFWIVVLENTPESPLDCKKIKSVNPKGNHSWIATDAEAETNTLAPWCEELTHWERPWRWERLKAGSEGDDRGWDGWMASLTQGTWVWANLGDGEGQGSLVCCSPWSCKESDTTEWLNNISSISALWEKLVEVLQAEVKKHKELVPLRHPKVTTVHQTHRGTI